MIKVTMKSKVKELLLREINRLKSKYQTYQDIDLFGFGLHPNKKVNEIRLLIRELSELHNQITVKGRI